MVKCREVARIVNVACLIGVGVNGDGRREVLGLDVVTAEDGAGWLAFLRGVRARGLKGVELVISDAHPGLKDAIASVLRGAVWYCLCGNTRRTLALASAWRSVFP